MNVQNCGLLLVLALLGSSSFLLYKLLVTAAPPCGSSDASEKASPADLRPQFQNANREAEGT